MDALDALVHAILLGYRVERRREYAAPGAVVAALPAETRQVLGTLTSDQLGTMRSYPDDSQATLRAREVRRLKLAFDARCSHGA